MKKKKQNLQRSSNGFENLIGVHTEALESNSKEIIKMLQLLSDKELSESNKKDLAFIKKELKRLNNDLDEIGEE